MSSCVRVRFAHGWTFTRHWFEGAGITWRELRERMMASHVCRGRKNGRAHEPYVLEACPPLRDSDFVQRNTDVIVRRRPAGARPDVVYILVPAHGNQGQRWAVVQ